MVVAQGDLELLNDPISQELLRSTISARLAYTWRDGSPRVVPIWFHWTGEDLVMGSSYDEPKGQRHPGQPAGGGHDRRQ